MAADSPSTTTPVHPTRTPKSVRPLTRVERLATPRGIFLSAVLIIAAIPVAGAIHDPDFWWHLRTGQLILERRGLLTTDPFTYTGASHSWVMHEWGTEVLFALLNRIGGLGMVVATVGAVTWLGVLCVYLRSRMRRPHHVPLGAGIVLALIAGAPIWGPRAQMITFACACLTLYLGDRFLRCGGRAAYWLIPLTLVWCNLHSGFVIGLAFIVLMVAAESAVLVARTRGMAPGFADIVPAARVRRLIGIATACLAVAIVNPYGPRIYLYPLETQASTAQQQLIQEWHSPNFHMWEPMPFAFLVLSLAVMVTVNRRISARDTVLVIAGTALALQSVRHIALFIAVATPVWIEQADMLGRRIGWIRSSVDQAYSPSRRPPRMMRPVAMTLVAVLTAAVLGGRLLPSIMESRDPSVTYVDDYPVCATRWLSASRPNLRIFNQYGEGGYLANHLFSKGDRVFIFGDAALSGDDMLRKYSGVESLQPGWDATIRDSGTELVVYDTNTPLAHVLEANPKAWRTVYSDPRTEAFVPTDRPVTGLAGPAVAIGQDPADMCRAFAKRGLKNP